MRPLPFALASLLPIFACSERLSSSTQDEAADDSSESGSSDSGSETSASESSASEPSASDSGSSDSGSSESSSSDSSASESSSSDSSSSDDLPAPACGDGAVDPGEQCDDGNDIDDDGCNDNCQYNLDPICFDDALPMLSEETRGNDPDGPGGVQLCDRSDAANKSPDWQGEGWYRFGELYNVPFYMFAPEQYSCGGTAGGWLASQYPSPQDGITDVEFCFALDGDECAFAVQAKMVNCWNEATRMWLPEVPDCDLRYCMGYIIPD